MWDVPNIYNKFETGMISTLLIRLSVLKVRHRGNFIVWCLYLKRQSMSNNTYAWSTYPSSLSKGAEHYLPRHPTHTTTVNNTNIINIADSKRVYIRWRSRKTRGSPGVLNISAGGLRGTFLGTRGLYKSICGQIKVSTCHYKSPWE